MPPEEPPLSRRLPQSNLGRNMGCMLLLALVLLAVLAIVIRGYAGFAGH